MRKVLLIGWDAADWKVIHPLMDRRKMPGVQHMVDHGTMGNLSTIHPVLSPMLWTSIATGKRPYQHGVHGFTEPDPEGNSIRPVSSLSRRCKAIWNILNQNDLRSIVIGWWPSHPVEPINGVMVSNDYHRVAGPIEEPWLLHPGTIHPPRLEEVLADLRVHPAELVAEQLLPFIPRVMELQRTEEPRVSVLAKVLAECSTIQAAATHVINTEPWDFMAVYFDAIDHFSHAFMRFHPPQQEGIKDDDFQLFQHVIDAAYQFHDMMLQRLLASVDDETTTILISDHGFHPDHLRPTRIPREPAGPAVEHRDHGIFVINGPEIREDHLIHSASVLDVTPTILTLFDLPVGQDMDGQPLTDIFVAARDVKTVPSWEDVAGESGMHPVHKRLGPSESQQAFDQLVALGYIERPSENVQHAIRTTIRESRYNLAQSYMDAGRFGEAIPILEDLWEEFPWGHRFGVRLAVCYQAMERTSDQRRVVETTLERRETEAQQAKQKLLSLRKQLKQQATKVDEAMDSSTETPSDPVGDDSVQLTADPTGAERAEYLRLRAAANSDPYFMHYLMGAVCHAEGKHDDALKHLAKAEEAQPRALALHNLLGNVYFEMQRMEDADRSYQRVLLIDPENAQAQLGLARTSLVREEFRQAAEKALMAIGLQYHMPLAHFVLGTALHRLGRLPQAIEALQLATAQNPRFLRAHARLEELYEQCGERQLASEHRQAIEAIQQQLRRAAGKQRALDNNAEPTMGAADVYAATNKFEKRSPAATEPAFTHGDQSVSDPIEAAQTASEPITIVSGLPRSGTSMMMQMLAAGGTEILADNHRAPDADNPRGYFEYEPVRTLRENNQWVPEACGKVVKVVTQLLPYLPDGQHYKIVFMQRELAEVLASQHTMLQRRGAKGATLVPEKLSQVFARQTESVKRQLADRADIEVLFVDYATTVAAPEHVASQVNRFLGASLNVSRMARAVDAQLYRRRVTESPT